MARLGRTFPVRAHIGKPVLGALNNYTLTASAGAFVLTGKAANLLAGHLLPAAAGSFALTGQAAGLLVTRKITAVAGAFTLTGVAAVLKSGRLLTAAPGAFILTGQAASLIYGTPNKVLVADAGSFVLTGQAANLIYIPVAADGGAAPTPSGGGGISTWFVEEYSGSKSQRRAGVVLDDKPWGMLETRKPPPKSKPAPQLLPAVTATRRLLLVCAPGAFVLAGQVAQFSRGIDPEVEARDVEEISELVELALAALDSGRS